MREVEEYFKESVEELRDWHLAQYPQNPPAHVFSETFEAGIRKVVTKEKNVRQKSRLGEFSRRAAGFLLAGSLGLFSCVVSVGAWSGHFFKMLEQQYPDHTEIRFEETGSTAAATGILTYELSWVPDGFRRVSHGADANGFLNYAVYENDNEDMLHFSQYPAGGTSIGLNTEGAELKDITLAFGPAKILENQGMCDILWYDDQYCYMVDSSLSREETIRIAEQVRLKAAPYPTLQALPIESIPASYPPKLALQNGDVVISSEGVENEQKLRDFIAACDQSADGSVRLVEYKNGFALISDLQMQGGHLYYTRDEHRWPESEQPWAIGEEYDSVSLLEANGKKVLMLFSQRQEQPVKVLEY